MLILGYISIMCIFLNVWTMHVMVQCRYICTCVYKSYKCSCTCVYLMNVHVISINTVDGHCFDYFPPPCVIPGSAKATISITGKRVYMLLINMIVMYARYMFIRNKCTLFVCILSVAIHVQYVH